MEARIIEDRLLWNRFVAASPQCHITQTYEWPEHADASARGDASPRLGVIDEHGRLVAAMLLVRSKAQGVRAPFFYAPRGPICADPSSPALPLLVAAAKREARKRGAFLIRAEPNVPQDDTLWPKALRGLGFRPTSHGIYPRGAWVTDISGSEEQILGEYVRVVAALHPRWREERREHPRWRRRERIWTRSTGCWWRRAGATASTSIPRRCSATCWITIRRSAPRAMARRR